MITAPTCRIPPLVGPNKCRYQRPFTLSNFKVFGCKFPSFLPQDVENIQDPFARKLASRIERFPVQAGIANTCIMSSFVKPKLMTDTCPVVLLHGFDSSCLEWRYTFPLLEDAGFETWAVDILGWGFSDLENRPSCTVASKCDHLYQLWSSYIKRPMILVGPSLGSAVAIDFTTKYPEAVDKLVLIDANVYAKGTGHLSKLPKILAYSGVYLLKSIPLRLFATWFTFNYNISLSTCWDWVKIGRLHCLLPWWVDTTVDFMIAGGYNVISQIKHVKQRTLILWGENDQLVSNKLAVRLHCELPNAVLRQIPDCGHIPHVEKPGVVANFITEFIQADINIGVRDCIPS